MTLDDLEDEDENNEENTPLSPENPWLSEESSRGTSEFSDCMREYDTSGDDEDDDSHDRLADIYEPLENAPCQLQETISAIMNAKIARTEHRDQGNTQANKEIASLKRSLSMKDNKLEQSAKRAKTEKEGLQKELAELKQSSEDGISLLEDTRTQLEKTEEKLNKEREATLN